MTMPIPYMRYKFNQALSIKYTGFQVAVDIFKGFFKGFYFKNKGF